MSPIIMGLIAAALASLPELIAQQASLASPLYVLGVALFAALVQKFYYEPRFAARVYDGMADLFIHIHSLYSLDSPFRWFWRSFLSLAFAIGNGIAGPEGAASEAAHGFALASRSPSERWSEQRRRTDAAAALAAGIAAAFQAPFAAVVVGLEMGIGGRALSSALSALTAYAGSLYISRHSGVTTNWAVFFKTSPMGDFEWGWILLIAGLSGAVGWFIVRFLRYFQESLVDLLNHRVWLRNLIGGIVLFVIYKLYPAGHAFPAVQLTTLLLEDQNWVTLGMMALSGLLALAVVLSAFGTIGIFWPLFMLGSVAGSLALSGVVGIFVGVSAVWAAVLGSPLTAAVLALEMTQSPKVMFAALVTGLIANRVRVYFRQKPLIHRHLEARGLVLLDGRSEGVLSSIQVSDAMVRDHECIYEHELVGNLTDKFLGSKHPFLPVVNRRGSYVGLLTLDLLQVGLESAERNSEFFEVKDLLIKSRSRKPRTVKESDTLAATSGIFGDHPCVAVLGADDQVVGLLFAYSVRAAYDREVARRALARRAKRQTTERKSAERGAGE